MHMCVSMYVYMYVSVCVCVHVCAHHVCAQVHMTCVHMCVKAKSEHQVLFSVTSQLVFQVSFSLNPGVN